LPNIGVVAVPTTNLLDTLAGEISGTVKFSSHDGSVGKITLLINSHSLEGAVLRRSAGRRTEVSSVARRPCYDAALTGRQLMRRLCLILLLACDSLLMLAPRGSNATTLVTYTFEAPQFTFPGNIQTALISRNDGGPASGFTPLDLGPEVEGPFPVQGGLTGSLSGSVTIDQDAVVPPGGDPRFYPDGSVTAFDAQLNGKHFGSTAPGAISVSNDDPTDGSADFVELQVGPLAGQFGDPARAQYTTSLDLSAIIEDLSILTSNAIPTDFRSVPGWRVLIEVVDPSTGVSASLHTPVVLTSRTVPEPALAALLPLAALVLTCRRARLRSAPALRDAPFLS
jgi:hypothetical protein